MYFRTISFTCNFKSLPSSLLTKKTQLDMTWNYTDISLWSRYKKVYVTCMSARFRSCVEVRPHYLQRSRKRSLTSVMSHQNRYVCHCMMCFRSLMCFRRCIGMPHLHINELEWIFHFSNFDALWVWFSNCHNQITRELSCI